MKITVLNGSPKGDVSVTMQYVHYLQQTFPQHQFEIFHIAQAICQIENDTIQFEAVINAVQHADGVLWAFPLYVFLVHANYKRFIELIRERNRAGAFRHKYTAALSTSIHFFDHTAHNYIEAVCDDLDMKYLGFFSAEMDDLLDSKRRSQFQTFAAEFLNGIAAGVPTAKHYQPLNYDIPLYTPGPLNERIDTHGKKIVIVAADTNPGTNLGKMLSRLQSLFSQPVERIDLDTLRIKGGCLGCIRCGYDNVCVYEDSDEVRAAYNRLKSADIVIYAGAIIDRYLSARWKLFIDRRFENTHQPILTGKQLGYIISGPLSQIPNLTEIFQAQAEIDQVNLAGIISDEAKTGVEIDALLADFARRLVRLAEQRYAPPRTFLGIGGTVIFRDAIWGKLRFVFQGDHRYYKQHGFYDFPQKRWGQRLFTGLMMGLTKIPVVRRQIQQGTKQHMIMPFQKVLGK